MIEITFIYGDNKCKLEYILASEVKISNEFIEDTSDFSHLKWPTDKGEISIHLVCLHNDTAEHLLNLTLYDPILHMRILLFGKVQLEGEFVLASYSIKQSAAELLYSHIEVKNHSSLNHKS